MKNILLTGAFLLLTFALIAQKKKHVHDEDEANLRFGFKGTVNINKLDGTPFKDKFSYNYQLGGFIQWNFSYKLGIQPEVNFAQSSGEISDDNTIIYDDLFLDGDQKKARLDYLKIPILLNVDIGPSQKVKLQVGPQWAQLLNSKVDSLKNPGLEIFKKGDFSLLGGIWIQLPAVHIGARYEIGLSNINNVTDKDKWKSQALQLFAGITF
ncbi:MAG: PorT family protein [Sphingobacteriales bacterium]|nr:PorT family protein [Sphingobacteriales bacterium]